MSTSTRVKKTANWRRLSHREKMGQATFYVYLLTEPVTNNVGYVGVSCNLWKRLQDHMRTASEVCYDHLPRSEWMRAIKKRGLVPQMQVVDVATFDTRFERERFWIREIYASGRGNEHFNRWAANCGCDPPFDEDDCLIGLS